MCQQMPLAARDGQTSVTRCLSPLVVLSRCGLYNPEKIRKNARWHCWLGTRPLTCICEMSGALLVGYRTSTELKVIQEACRLIPYRVNYHADPRTTFPSVYSACPTNYIAQSCACCLVSPVKSTEDRTQGRDHDDLVSPDVGCFLSP